MTQTKAELLQTRHQGDIRLGDANSSHYVGFKAPATVGSNLVWTLPAADGSANQFLQTNASGVLSWGTADTSASMPLTGGTFTGDVTFDGATAGRDIIFDRSENRFQYNDNAKASFGTANDFYIAHDGTNTDLATATAHNIWIRNVDGTNEAMAAFRANGACELYHNGTKKIETSAAGVSITGSATISTDLTVTGDLTVSGTTTTINTQTLDVEDKNVVIGKVSSPSDTTADGGGWTLKGASDKTFNWVNATDAWTSSEHIHLGDNKRLLVGTGSDLEIWHDGSNSYIKDGGTGNLIIRASDQLKIQETDNGETMAVFNKDGAVDLYHNNVKKLETTSGGINVTGAIQVNGAALASGNTFTAVANGSIANNKAVKIETDGKVAEVKMVDSASTNPINKGGGIMQSQAGMFLDACRLAENKGVVISRGWGSTQVLQVKIVQQSATSTAPGDLSSGSWTQASANSTSVQSPSVTRISDTKFCVVWGQVSPHGIYARVGTVSGTTITFGSIATVTTDQIRYEYGRHQCQCDENSGKVVAFYTRDPGGGSSNEQIYARVLTISGTSISVGSESSSINGTKDNNFRLTYDTQRSAIVMFYQNAASSNNGYTRAITVSGTSVTSHGAQHVVDGSMGEDMGISYDATNNRIMYSWDKSSTAYINFATMNSSHVISVNENGTGHSYSGGSVVQVDGGYPSSPQQTCVEYDPAIDKYLYTLTWNDGRIYAHTVTLSGTAFTTGGTATNIFNQVNCEYNTLFRLRNGLFYSYFERSSNGYPYFNLVSTVLTASNLVDGHDYVGFADQAYTNGQTATIKTTGNNVTTLSGLTAGTKYYVQGDGTLGTSAGSPSCLAGVALSSSKLLIREGKSDV